MESENKKRKRIHANAAEIRGRLVKKAKFDTRINNILRKAGITNYQQFANYTEEDLLKFWGIGKGVKAEIIRRLELANIKLKESELPAKPRLIPVPRKPQPKPKPKQQPEISYEVQDYIWPYDKPQPKLTLKLAKQVIAFYEKQGQKQAEVDKWMLERLNKAKHNSQFWHGKFLVVKNENNKLRKLVSKQNSIISVKNKPIGN